MRAWCNSIKSALLGPIHDPLEPQTYRVIQQAYCPISNASTWLIWWNGEAVPRPSHIATAEQIVPSSAQHLDLHGINTPLQRNLHAIDLLRRQIPSAGIAQRECGDPAWRLLRSLDRTWCSQLDMARLHSKWAEAPSAFGNGLPAFLEYSALEPVSAFRYLMRLATSPDIGSGRRLSDWSLDLATAAMAIRTLVEITNVQRPSLDVTGLGVTYVMLALAAGTFWLPRADFDVECHELHAAQVFGNSSGVALAALARAREAYFAHFLSLGIADSVVRNLIDPHRSISADAAFKLSRAAL